MTQLVSAPSASSSRSGGGLALSVLLGLALCHLLNDAIQSLLPALYPLMKAELQLSFSQIGMVGLVFQITASVFQPAVGLVFDRHPRPWPLPLAMCALSAGIVLLAFAETYPAVLFSAFVIGIGSAIFHPEASRGTRLAAGRRIGFGQSLFQFGGNLGSACGPLLAAFLIVPQGHRAILFCLALSLIGFAVVVRLSSMLFALQAENHARVRRLAAAPETKRPVGLILATLTFLVCTKNVYTSSMQNYYSFHLIETFELSVSQAQLALFAFLGSVAIGTLIGGLLTDRIGTRRMINFSIIGALPFSFALPHAGLAGTIALSVCVGLILSSAFSALVVYGQELLPKHVGLVAGLFFGLAFGVSGLAAAGIGILADRIGLSPIMQLCGMLPAAGLLSLWLPDLSRRPTQTEVA